MMGSENISSQRRRLLQGLGGAVAFAALAPSLLDSTSAEASAPEVLRPGSPEGVDMSAERIEDTLARIQRRVNDGLFPGAVALIARRGIIVAHRAFGNKVAGATDPVALDTLFDLESMSKVLATSTAAMILVEQGVIALHDPVAKYLPAFAAKGKGAITIRDLLRYSSGLPVDNQFLDDRDRARVWQLMAQTPLEYPTGTKVLYSDLGYRLLGRTLEVAAGMDLNALAQARIWGPLGMNDTTYNPPASLVSRVAATAHSSARGYLVRGEVQDEQDFALGGIVGCDGVFSTALDIAVFCQMMLNGGRYGGIQILSRQTAAEMVTCQTPQVTAEQTDVSPISNLLETPKGYGWELFARRFSSGGMRLRPGSYGKAGGAGTFMWIDPSRELFGVILTNHGLPVPFEEPGWNKLIDNVGCAEFFDGMVNALTDE
jgi:CubicO group peptidase (beta-lactamase class C family)